MGKHNFGEKEKEFNLPVWPSPKYLASKKKAIEMIESGKYGLEDSDFWILMNMNKDKTQVIYSGLIISHNGCLKINDNIEDKFKPEAYSVIYDSDYTKGLLAIYNDGSLIEYGEVSPANCKNAYPWAMLLKRVFDRVVLKKSKLAYAGVYSDSEADEFKEPEKEEEQPEKKSTNGKICLQDLVFLGNRYTGERLLKFLEAYKIKQLEDLPQSIATKIIEKIKEEENAKQ